MNNLISLLLTSIAFLIFNYHVTAQEQNCAVARGKYLEQNPDVAKAGMDAWNHYTTFGKREGRKWPDCTISSEASGPRFKTNNSIASVKFDMVYELLQNKKAIDRKLSEYDSIQKIEEKILIKLDEYTIPIDHLEQCKRNYSKLNSSEYDIYIIQNRKKNISKHKMNVALKFFNSSKIHKNHDSLIVLVNKNKGSKSIYWVFESNSSAGRMSISQAEKQYFKSSLSIIDFDAFKESRSTRAVFQIIKKHKSSLVVPDGDKAILIKQITGLDAHYFELEKQLKEIKEKCNLWNSQYRVDLNPLYFYFGEKTNDRANGYGYLICKSAQNSPVILEGKWADNCPIYAVQTNLYSDLPNVGELPSLEIYNSNNNHKLVIENKGLRMGECRGKTMEGSGFFLWKNGDYFVGTMQEGKRVDGLYAYGNGEKYYGKFNLEGQFSGPGKYYWPDGSVYDGNWQYNQRTGYGKYTSKNGSVQEGIFQNGSLVKSKETIDSENREAEEKRQEQLSIAEEKKHRESNEISSSNNDISPYREYIKNKLYAIGGLTVMFGSDEAEKEFYVMSSYLEDKLNRTLTKQDYDFITTVKNEVIAEQKYLNKVNKSIENVTLVCKWCNESYFAKNGWVVKDNCDMQSQKYMYGLYGYSNEFCSQQHLSKWLCANKGCKCH